ncbi:FeoA family protein [Cellulomonas sp.]|uniref:FeoA family protein n=1 Tax=Cellulomonas sp. TaxID=40001 RepID=UPI003BABFD8B
MGVRLRDLPRGARATVVEIDGAAPATRARLRDLGFRAGCEVVCVRRAPWGSPVLFRVGESDLCLRRDLSSLVVIEVQS